MKEMTSNEFITLLKQNNWNGQEIKETITVGGWLDLRHTAITSFNAR